MIRAAVCDDDKHFVDQLETILVNYGKKENEIIRVNAFYNGKDFLKFNCTFDIIFLDISMPEQDGMQVAAEIRKKDLTVSIVFLTSWVNKAPYGYRFHAMDYLLKPATDEKITDVMDRWRKEKAESEPLCLLVENRTGHYRIPIASLRYMEIVSRKLILHVKEESIACYKKLSDLKRELGPHGFAQSERGILVNLSYVESIKSYTDEVVLVTHEALHISRAMKKEFMRQLTRYWGEHIW